MSVNELLSHLALDPSTGLPREPQTQAELARDLPLTGLLADLARAVKQGSVIQMSDGERGALRYTVTELVAVRYALLAQQRLTAMSFAAMRELLARYAPEDE